MRRLLPPLSALLVLPALLAAQTVRGVVVDATDRPVAGVVMLLLDAGSNVAGRTLSDAQGEFRLTVGKPGSYRIRTARIGFRPLNSDPIVLTAGTDVTRRLALTDVPFTLDTVRATGRNACRVVARDSVATAWAVWEQVRTALTSTQLTTASRVVGATTLSYERTNDVTTNRITKQSSNVQSAVVAQPWRSLTPDVLRRTGYVVADSGGFTTYNAPGIDALLSDAFLEDHCVRLTNDDPKVFGIDFEPTGDRKKVAEISGRLLLDRKTSELRHLEFKYVNVSRDVEKVAGGAMDFARMRNGAWVISRWSIRMPVFAQREGVGGRGFETRMTEVRTTGGELILATTQASRGRDTLWSRSALALAGMIRDSVTGGPVRNARITVVGTPLEGVTDGSGRFSIAGAMPGNYVVEVRTPSLDSVNAVSEFRIPFTDSSAVIELRVSNASQVAARICGAGSAPSSGIIVGVVSAQGDSAAARNAAVDVEWSDLAIQHDAVERSRHSRTARTDSTGTFRVCGVPVNTDLTFSAKTQTLAAVPVVERIPTGQRFARVELVLAPQVATPAVFIGMVLTDSAHKAIANAEVSLPELSLTTVTDDNGIFRINGIAPGGHQVVVRRIGYGPLDTRLDFGPNQTIERTVYLNRVVTLDSVVVNAPQRDPLMDAFEEHKKRGFGFFIDRSALAKMEGGSTAATMSQAPGFAVARGNASQAWVTSNISPPSGCSFVIKANDQDDCLRKEKIFYVPEAFEQQQGMKRACYAIVYLDRSLMNPGTPTPPFDLNTIPVISINAMEWYATAGQVPVQYSTGTGISRCGLLVIHTRR